MFGFSMRAISIVVAFFYTLLALSTCGAQGPLPTGEGGAAEASLGQSGEALTTLHILSNRGEVSLELQQAIQRYQQERGDLRISVQTVSSRAEYQAVLRARLVSGQQVDLFHMGSHREVLSLEEHLMDLSELSWLEQAVEGTLDPVTVEDRIYGVPYGIEGVGLIANEEIFREAELSWDEVEDFEQLNQLFYELRLKILNYELDEEFPALEAVTELPAMDREFLADQLADIALSDAFSTPVQAARAQVLALEYPQGLEKYVNLMASYTSNRRSWGELTGISRNRQVESGLATGRVAVIQQNTGIYKQVRQANPQLADQLRLYPVYLEDMEEGSVYVGVPVYWGVNAASQPESQKAALEFLTWLYRSEEGAKVLAEELGALSPYADTRQETGNPLHSQMLSYMAQGRTRPWLHREAPEDWGQVFAAGIRGYLGNEVDWEAVVEESVLQWTQLQ